MTILDISVIVIYLITIVSIGMFVGKTTTSTDEFFFAGRRFTWPWIACSCVATLVGSYSFIQYAQIAYTDGFGAIVGYTNDWYVLPLFFFAWLPFLYKHNIQSVPEYFAKRFDKKVRVAVLCFILVYLIGYIGINLLTIGIAAHSIFPWAEMMPASPWFYEGTFRLSVIIPAAFLAVLSGLYLHKGGQNSVIVTDFIQGGILLFAGLLVFVVGVNALDQPFWEYLSTEHRNPFPHINQKTSLNGAGLFWSDGVVGTFAFYFINQGILMRFLSAKSINEGRKALLFVVAFVMPIAAIAVAGAGWIATGLVAEGVIQIGDPKNTFMVVAKSLLGPGWFGFVVVAVLAALMSTLDTLITAVAAVAVNDIVRPLYPKRKDAFYLRLAQRLSVCVTFVGIALIPLFDSFDSVFAAISFFTSMVIPPLILVILGGLLFPKYDAFCALWTLILGSVAMALSIIFPDIVTPFAHGIAKADGTPYKFIRSFYGVFISTIIAVALYFYQVKQTEQKEV